MNAVAHDRRETFFRGEEMVRTMVCPVCGLPDAATPCARCGTDLRALDASEARLEIVRVAVTGSARPSSRETR